MIAEWDLGPEQDFSHDHVAFAVAYGGMIMSGFLMGLLCGWVAWG